MELSQYVDALNAHFFLAKAYPTAAEAKEAALRIIGNRSVGIGGTKTVVQAGVYDALKANGNTVYCHTFVDKPEKEAMRQAEQTADVFLTSVNGVTLDGTLVNIDGTGNRVAAMLFGPKTVIVIAGKNKLAKDYADAVERTRRECCPKNAARQGLQTPCALTGKCTDCKSPQRMCCAFVTFAYPTKHVTDFHVLLVDEELGW